MTVKKKGAEGTGNYKLSPVDYFNKFTNFQNVLRNTQSQLNLHQQISIYYKYMLEQEQHLRTLDCNSATGSAEKIRSAWVYESLARKIYEVADYFKIVQAY